MSTIAAAAAAPAQQGGFRRMWRAIKQLFHEVIGTLFAIIAFVWLSSAFRAWKRDVAYWLITIAVAVAVLFVFFAVTSFRKARKL
jgi:cell division protein FtsW (lipid II flippase)